MKHLILLLFVLFLLLVGTVSNAVEVVLCWDHSIDRRYLLRYNVYSRTNLAEPYVSFSENPTTNNLVGTVSADVATYTVTIPDGQRTWFVVTATDTRELESDWSNEVPEVSEDPGELPAPPPNVHFDDGEADNGGVL